MNQPSTSAPPPPSPSTQDTGLSSTEASARLAQAGANAMPDTDRSPWLSAFKKLSAPVPWMLEAAIVLELVLGKQLEAAIIFALLMFNAILGLVQETRATATLKALKSQLALNATAKRDGAWKTIPAADLVVGDIVKISLGGIVPADVSLIGGEVLLDQSMLTGESMPIEAGPGKETFAGALIRRGEAVARVTATSVRTKFGRTAELVRIAHTASAQQKAVMGVVRNLAIFNGGIVVLLVAYALFLHLPWNEILPLVLTAMLASIPVALPATFTLASALGARALAREGVLPTRLSAVDEAATMDLLCSDKTGTLTRNALTVAQVQAMDGHSQGEVLALACLASSEGGQDPVDTAIRSAAKGHSPGHPLRIQTFTPFDPASKMAQAMTQDEKGTPFNIVKGAFATVAKIASPSQTAIAAAQALEGQGFRVLAVAGGPPDALKLIGMIALSDPPRDDSAPLIAQLHGMGVRVVMVTGDAPATAAIVAHAVGLDGPICPPGPIAANLRARTYAVFAGVLPEDKFNLVKDFQSIGHTVGMCGDGANDAPALRQAQIGIAVASATDVAKSAAGMVLTKPGLFGIVAAVKEGRIIFQRILTYTLNSIVKKIVTVLFLGAGLVMTGHAILTPLLMVILMVAGDFLAMSLTADNVAISPKPNVWRINNMTRAGIFLGLCQFVFCIAVLALGIFWLHLPAKTQQTLAFVTLVFSSQAMIYALRERRHMWRSRPSTWLVISSLIDVLIAMTLAMTGLAMTALPLPIIAGLLGASVIFAFVLDLVKIPVFARLELV
ncbi:MAG: HAD-IC family P-type ATPase [Hyphomicrobiales bacterium]|nr:HAD-IC family P-type ATPase [Hyphomicrobiales bacterium]MDE2113233.1 HAD-IC family P-type ATPase [Hyphomicrobiales bacterium]